MKFEEEAVQYFPGVVTVIKQIDNNDIANKTLVLPEKASVVGKNALPSNVQIKKVIILNADYQIRSKQMRHKLNPEFVLTSGTEIVSLFYNIKASKVVLPNTLKVIKDQTFQYSKINELEIPDSVEVCEDEAFKKSVINKLIINEKLLSQISAKHVLTSNKKTTLIVKSEKGKKNQYIISKLDVNDISSLGYIDEAIDMFVDSLLLNKTNDDTVNKLKKRLKTKFLIILKIKLLFGKNEDISINDLALHDIYFNNMLKNISDNISHESVNISCDGFTIKKDGEKIKSLSLKEFLNTRY